MISMKEIIAVFDFDETLGIGISGLRFFRYFLGKKRFYFFMLRASLWHLLFVTQNAEHYALNKIFSLLFKNRTVDEVTAIAERFSKEVLPHCLYDKVLERLKWHQAQGHRTIIISGSLDIYLRPLAEYLAVDNLIATQLETTDTGYFTGRIEKHYYVGKNKLHALRELLGNPDAPVAYAYGNSSSDRYILAVADYAYFIRHPADDIDKALVDAQTHQQWMVKYRI